jgi:ATP-dependent Zn protease
LTEQLVKQYKDKIDKLASAVLKKESLNHEEIKDILGERPFEIKENYK